MRKTCLAIAASLLSGVALAQNALPSSGARPGREPGVGESLPRSEHASNIGPGTARALAPSLPQPALGEAAGAPDYIQAARAALASGRTGLAQQSMEMAETRLLDRVVPDDVIAPSAAAAVIQLRRARQALDAGERAQAMQLLDAMAPN